MVPTAESGIELSIEGSGTGSGFGTGSGSGSSGGHEEAGAPVKIRLVHDELVEEIGDKSALWYYREYTHMRDQEWESFYDEIRFTAHFHLTLLRAGVYARDFEVKPIRVRVRVRELRARDFEAKPTLLKTFLSIDPFRSTHVSSFWPHF